MSDLTDIPMVDHGMAVILELAGYETIADVAETDPCWMVNIVHDHVDNPAFAPKDAFDVVSQAEAEMRGTTDMEVVEATSASVGKSQ